MAQRSKIEQAVGHVELGQYLKGYKASISTAVGDLAVAHYGYNPELLHLVHLYKCTAQTSSCPQRLARLYSVIFTAALLFRS